MATKRYPLPKRFNVALTDKAYENLRKLNEKYHYGNNYLLTIILENFATIADNNSVEEVFENFKKNYGAPSIVKK